MGDSLLISRRQLVSLKWIIVNHMNCQWHLLFFGRASRWLKHLIRRIPDIRATTFDSSLCQPLKIQPLDGFSCSSSMLRPLPMQPWVACHMHRLWPWGLFSQELFVPKPSRMCFIDWCNWNVVDTTRKWWEATKNSLLLLPKNLISPWVKRKCKQTVFLQPCEACV